MATTTPKPRHRSFHSKRDENLAPLTFDLEEQNFEARPAIPGAVLLELVAHASDEGAESAGAIVGFFEKALVAESYERFNVLVNDPDVIISIETLVEILSWLIEEYTSRPTSAS